MLVMVTIVQPHSSIISNPEPCYNQNYDEFPTNFTCFNNKFFIVKIAEGLHSYATFECSTDDSNIFSIPIIWFDHFQPRNLPSFSTSSRSENGSFASRKKGPKEIVTKTFLMMFKSYFFRETPKNHPAFCNNDDDDDDEEYTIAITPVLPTEKPDNSLSMWNEHLDTIPATESDEVIKSSVENLVPIPSESEDFSDIESDGDEPDCDDSQTTNFLTEFNPIHNEDLDSTPKNDRFDTESYLLDSLLNRDYLMASYPKDIDLSPRWEFAVNQINSSRIVIESTRNILVSMGEDCPDFEASHARGFVLRSLELQILSFIMGIQYPNLID
ncbi:hypothetical protein Tco_1292010 [Tanacetum coccineum]